jgi:hypothetical protein
MPFPAAAVKQMRTQTASVRGAGGNEWGQTRVWAMRFRRLTPRFRFRRLWKKN